MGDGEDVCEGCSSFGVGVPGELGEMVRMGMTVA